MSRCLGDLLGHAECGMSGASGCVERYCDTVDISFDPRSCEPEINKVKFEPDKQYILLLCSDGVWESWLDG